LNAIDCPHFPAIASVTPVEESAREPETVDFRKLTAAIHRGDEDAFDKLHAHCALPLFQRLLRATRGNEALARELTQTAFLKLARSSPVCTDEASLQGWLWQVARRTWLDLLRRQKRYEALPPQDLAAPDESKTHPLNEILHLALAELPPDARELLQAFYIDERPLSEIAAERGLTYKAAESRLSRLRSALRERILHLLRHES
jgi:RNA polymerase sigma-70 factor (ECF subfamily)